MNKIIIFSFIGMLGLSSCAVIRPGQVGVKSRLGKLSEKTVDAGLMFYNPLVSSHTRTNTNN